MTLIYFVWAYVTSYLCALNKSLISIFKNMIFWWFLSIFMWVSHNFDCFFCFPNPGGQNDANDGFYFSKPTNIDQVYIHRWSMWVAFKEVDGLIVSRTFIVIRKFPGPTFCKHFSWEILEPNHTAYAMVLLVIFVKVSHETHSFELRMQNTGYNCWTNDLILILKNPTHPYSCLAKVIICSELV